MASRYDLIITENAHNGFDDICTYITEQLCNPAASNKLASKIKNKLLLLKDFPEMGAVFHENHRRCVIESIIVLYRVDDIRKHVIVTDIVDGRTNYAPDF